MDHDRDEMVSLAVESVTPGGAAALEGSIQVGDTISRALPAPRDRAPARPPVARGWGAPPRLTRARAGIDGESLAGLPASRIVALFRGPAGSAVRVTFLPKAAAPGAPDGAGAGAASAPPVKPLAAAQSMAVPRATLATEAGEGARASPLAHSYSAR